MQWRKIHIPHLQEKINHQNCRNMYKWYIWFHRDSRRYMFKYNTLSYICTICYSKCCLVSVSTLLQLHPKYCKQALFIGFFKFLGSIQLITQHHAQRIRTPQLSSLLIAENPFKSLDYHEQLIVTASLIFGKKLLMFNVWKWKSLVN